MSAADQSHEGLDGNDRVATPAVRTRWGRVRGYMASDDVRRRATMVLDTESRVVDDYRSHERQLFESAYSYGITD